jgi:hypothetical protein
MKTIYHFNKEDVLENIGAATVVLLDMCEKATELKDLDRAAKILEKINVVFCALEHASYLSTIMRTQSETIKRLQEENIKLSMEINRLKEVVEFEQC